MKLKISLIVLLTASCIIGNVHAQSWQWANAATGGLGRATCYDNHGAVYAGGDYGDSSLAFGTDTIHCTSGKATFIVKYDLSGTLIWLKNLDLRCNLAAMACDKNGNLYVAGSFDNYTMTIDGVILTRDASHSSAYLAKYNSAGTLIWAKNNIAGPGIMFYGMNVDAHGNINIVGNFLNTSLTFAGVTYPNTSNPNYRVDGFIARYDSSGNSLWARTYGGATDEYVYAVASNSNDDVYITGAFDSDTIQAGGTTVLKKDTDGTFDLIVMKYDANGNLKWVKNAGGGGANVIESAAFHNEIRVDGNGNVAVIGTFRGTSLTFDGITVNGYAGCENSFVVQYNASGAAQWAKGAFGFSNMDALGLTIDNSNNIYVMGSFANTITLGTQNLTSAGMSDIYVFKMDAAGAIKWAVQAGGAGFDLPQKMNIDATGNLYVTGYYQQHDLVIGGNTYSLVGGSDFFLAKLSNTVGIDELSNHSNALTIFPNPVSGGQFTISFKEGLHNATMQIFNTLGEEVYSGIFSGMQHNVNSKLHRGIYFVRVSDEERQWVQKIVIE